MEEQAVTLEEFEAHIDALREQASLGDKLRRLENNKDFQDIVLNEYFREEAIRLIHLTGDSEWQTPEKQKLLEKLMGGIHGLRSFFSRIHNFSERARRDVDEAQIERDRFLEEDGE